MKLYADQLDRALDRPLAAAWLVAGDEPLLVAEATDAIRAKARTQGYTEREIHFVERGFDWSSLAGSSRALSLFADRKLVELKLATPKPGIEGGKVLTAMAQDPAPDTILLVVTSRLDRDAWSASWVKAFESKGAVVQTAPVEIEKLPQWVAARGRKLGLTLDAAAATLVAERAEGNLLAAQQELDKLALTLGEGVVDVDTVAAAVADSARYDVFQLGEAALTGDAARALRILQGLEGEGAEPTLVLWTLCRDLRAVAQARRGVPPPMYGKGAERRAEAVREAAKRMARVSLKPLLEQAGRIDRVIKGQRRGDAWTELAALVARLAGVPALEPPPSWAL